MAFRDLLYKIVPGKMVIRELITSQNKKLESDDRYELKERKKFVTVGKKTHVEYVYDIDLKPDPEKQARLQREQEEKLEQKRRNTFYLNMKDFGVYKLQCVVFLIFFPITFTLTIFNVWLRLTPNAQLINNALQNGVETQYNKKDLENANKARVALKEFIQNMLKYFKELTQYLDEIRDSNLIQF